MNNIYKLLEKKIISDERFVSEGKILRNKVIECALKLDEKILTILLEDEQLSKAFFCEVNNIKIFDKIKFQNVINNKEFLPNSYTVFKNHIGLEDLNNKNISMSNDVVLTWAYKDCFLEGGQNVEADKRDEVFYNEVLASDEIDRLCAPKVITNFKKIDGDGEHIIDENIEFNDENFIIKGNNLLALISLLPKYRGKVKLIYIDPPYNTGSDEFGYNDSFTHSTWLTFMKNRLEIAKELLSEDGLIFVQINSSRNNKGKVIGTSELPYLNVLLDEIFERENFVAHLHWKKKKQPSFLSKVAGVMESILVYAKKESEIGKLIIGQTTDITKRIDNSSNKFSERLINKGVRYYGNENCTISKGKYQNKTMVTEFLDDVIVKNGRVVNDFRAIAKFRNVQEEITRFCNEDLFYITANNSFRRYKSIEEMNSGKPITDLLLDWGQNQDSNSELKQLFNIDNDEKVFNTPKPELLLHNIISCTTEEGDLVLDFFLGSGTTSAVAHKLNRRYIGIEQMTNVVDNVILTRMKKVIEGEQGGVSNLCKWNGGGSFIYCELKELNEKYVDKIDKCNSVEDILEVVEELKMNKFANYKIDFEEFEKYIDDFKKLEINDMKKFLLETIDKNQLYVNFSEIDDEDLEVSDIDKKFNNKFYKGGI